MVFENYFRSTRHARAFAYMRGQATTRVYSVTMVNGTTFIITRKR